MYENNESFAKYLNEVVEMENLLFPLPQREIERQAREFIELVKELSKYDSVKEFLRQNPLNLDAGRGKMPLFLILDAVNNGKEVVVVYFESKYMSFKIDDVDKLKEKVGMFESCYIINILASISEEALVEIIKLTAKKARQDWKF